MPLKLDPHDAVFVVFRSSTTVQSVTVTEPEVETLAVLEGPWDVSFPPGHGAPARARFDQLSSWTENSDPGVKYFSGVATYAKTISFPAEWPQKQARLHLDLGVVKNLAEVVINGVSIGVAWKPPFKLDITEAIKAGDNRLEIRIANLWPNRLIGDKQPGASKIAYANFDPFTADTPLLPSGLMGPVVLLASKLLH